HVLEPEPGGDGEVDLVGGQRELTADRALYLHVDLGAVERGLVLRLDERYARLHEDRADHLLRLVPQLGGVYVLLAQTLGSVIGEAHDDVRYAEELEVPQVEVDDRKELVFELLFGAVDVGVVHLRGAHAQQAGEGAGVLVAVAGAVLGKAQWQDTVAARPGREDLEVERAVHGLDVVALAVLELHGREHVLLVVRKVTGDLVKAAFGQVRAPYAGVSALGLDLLGKAFYLVDHHRAAREPQRQAGSHVLVEHEDVELGAQLAV